MSTLPTNSRADLLTPADERQPFYVTGGTLPISASSYVEREADATLRNALRRGEFCYVLNTRQMGKSSLMARTAGQLRDDTIAVAVLDLAAIGQNLTVTQWYNGLLERVGQQLGLEAQTEACWQHHADAGPMQRFLGALREVVLTAVPGDFVIFIDEIDAVRSLPFATDELFAGIRELYNRRTIDPELNRLTFCLLGVATPADLIRDTRTTPFNIGKRIDLDDFTPAEAAPLAQGMVGSQDVLDRVLHWTGGHPYLTQRLCLAIADEPKNVTPADVDALCERLFLSRRARDTEDNLLFVRERVLRSELDIAALLTLYARVLRGSHVPDDPADPLASALKLTGLLKADVRGRLIVRNRIYAHVFDRAWVTENMPGGELRRQRQAFWRGALRTGAVAAVIIAIIGALAFVAIKEAREADRQAHEAKRQASRFEHLLYVSDMQNAQAAWDNGNGSRLRDLLAQTQSSPDRGWEWGYWNHLAYPPGESVNPGDGPLVSCDITPDGSYLITAGSNGMIRIWDARTLRQLRNVRCAGKTLSAVAFSHDGSEFSATDQVGTVFAYNANSTKLLFSLEVTEREEDYQLSPDFKIALQTTQSSRKLLSTVTGRTIALLSNHTQDGYGFANANATLYGYSANQHMISIYSSQTGVRLCDFRIPKTSRQDTFVDTYFSNDDRHLVIRDYNNDSVDLWDAQTGQFVHHLTYVSSSHNFVMPDTHLPIILVHDGPRLQEYSTETGLQIFDVPYADPLQTYQPEKFSQNGRYLGCLSTNGGIFVIDCKTGARIGNTVGRLSIARDLAFSPDSRLCFTVSNDGTLQHWSPSETTQAQWRTVHFPPGSAEAIGRGIHLFNDQHNAVTFAKTHDSVSEISVWNITSDCANLMTVLAKSPAIRIFTDDYNFVVLTPVSPSSKIGASSTSYIYDLRKGCCVGHAPGASFAPLASSVSPDGRLIAIPLRSNDWSVYTVKDNVPLWTTKEDGNFAGMAGFSSSGRLLACQSNEHDIGVWEAATGRRVALLKPPSTSSSTRLRRIAIPPGDHRVIATWYDQSICCWDIATGRCTWKIQSLRSIYRGILFSPDGQRFITAAKDTVDVWDAQTGEPLLTIRCNGEFPHANFSPDGNTLEIDNGKGGYINYVSDMSPHGSPAAAGIQ